MLSKLLADWLDQAVAQLRSRRAAEPVRRELAQHLADQYQALLDQGFPPEEAAARTVREMGDPVLVGGQLDRVHRPSPALAQTLPIALALLAGGLLQWALGQHTGTVNDARIWLGAAGSLAGALAAAGLAVAVLLLTARFLDIGLLERRAGTIYLCYLAAAGLYLALGMPVSGRSPLAAALALLFVPVWTAVLYRQRGRYLAGLLTAGAAVAPGLIFCLESVQTEMGVLMGLCCLALCLWCCARDWFGLGARLSVAVVAVGSAALIAALALLLLGGAQAESLLRWVLLRFQPSADPDGAGYFPLYLEGMHRCSRLIGQGMDPALLGGVFARYPEGLAHLPAVTGGSWQLSYLGWRFGLLAAGLLAGAAAGSLALLWRAALRCRNALGRLLAVGCALLLSAGLLANLLGNLGLPLDGFVPFFGRGGTLHCAEALLAGLLLSAFRTDPVGDGARVADRCAARAVCYRDGVLTIRLRR